MVLKEVLPLDLPLCISIEPTNVCNFKCIMCDHGTCEDHNDAKPLKNMSMEMFEKIVSDIERWVSECDGKRIKLIKLYSIGEPLIHPNICEMVKIIKEANICEKIEITTNGSLLTKQIADKMVEYGLDICRISIYAVSDFENERITQSKVKIEDIYNNVKYLYNRRKNEGKPYIVAKMIDAGENNNRLFEERYREISDLTAIDELMQNGLDNNDTFDIYYKDNRDQIKTNTLSDRINRERKICRYPFTHMTVRNDGTVVVCCSDWLKELTVGNVGEASLSTIWKSKRLYDFRKDMINNKGSNHRICRYCDIPYRDTPEDDIEDISIDDFYYEEDERNV